MEGAVSLLEVAQARIKARGIVVPDDGSLSGAVFEQVGIPILAGCEKCQASLGCYNAFPSQSGYTRCEGCIGSWGFPTVEAFEGWCKVQDAGRDQDEDPLEGFEVPDLDFMVVCPSDGTRVTCTRSTDLRFEQDGGFAENETHLYVFRCDRDHELGTVKAESAVEALRLVDEDVKFPRFTKAQYRALKDLCERYRVDFRPEHYVPQFDLPAGYVAGWIGGRDIQREFPTIFCGCSPDGDISS